MIMKKIIIALFVCCSAVFCSCSDDDKLPVIRPAQKGEFTDDRDGNTYGWVRIGDLEWMTENLKYQVNALPYYESTYDVFGTGYPVSVRSQLLNTDFEADYEKYGNFYTWKEAVENCPEGWRLPTDEDWKNLEMALGMSARDADAEGWRGNREATLLQQGAEGTGMALLLGGEAASTAAWETGLFLSFVGEYGYWWSASEVKDNGLQTPTVWCRKISVHHTNVYRVAMTQERLMRVRCCRDAGK